MAVQSFEYSRRVNLILIICFLVTYFIEQNDRLVPHVVRYLHNQKKFLNLKILISSLKFDSSERNITINK